MAERVGRQLGDRDNAHAEKVTLFFVIVLFCSPHCCCFQHFCHHHRCHHQLGDRDNAHAEKASIIVVMQ